jgi:hypothetical protein
VTSGGQILDPTTATASFYYDPCAAALVNILASAGTAALQSPATAAISQSAATAAFINSTANQLFHFGDLDAATAASYNATLMQAPPQLYFH